MEITETKKVYEGTNTYAQYNKECYQHNLWAMYDSLFIVCSTSIRVCFFQNPSDYMELRLTF